MSSHIRAEPWTPPDTEPGIDLGRRLAPGTLLAGRYRIETALGMGGMGVVYRAVDEELGATVAVKVLRPDLGSDPQWVERFRRELLLARQVTHRNVVRIHDIGESDGLRFLTMGYVEGRSLAEVLAQDGPLSVDLAVSIVRQLADGLHHAHEAGVVHRDLKPGNVLVGKGDTAYITDFGIARSVAGESLTRAEAVVGTPDYLAPEQIAGDPVDGRSDVYALGIVFYEMLTGRLPFPGDSRAEALAARIGGRTRDLRASGLRAPAYVQSVIDRCLERSPALRYASAAELLRDLDRRQAPRARFRAPSPRALAIAGAALLVVLAGAGTLWRRGRLSRPAPLPAAVGAAPAAPDPASAPPPRASLAVLPLADQTADPSLAWTGTGIADMLAGQLSESAAIRVIDPRRLFRTVRDLQLQGDRLDEGELRRFAELLEVDHVLAGTVRRAGPTVRVDLRLLSVGAGAPVRTRYLGAEAGQPAELFRVVTGLGKEVRRDLDASAEAEEASDPETASLPAARAYREGFELLTRGDSVGAAPALERAVAADEHFAAALDRLSEAYQNLGYRDKAVAAAQKAAAAVRPAQRRLALRIQARRALLEGDPAAAEKSFRERVRLYPQDTEALLDLASAQSSQGDLARTVATLRQASLRDRADPRIWFLLGKNAILMGEAAPALNDYLVRALTLETQLKNEQGRADVLNAMGVGYQQVGDYGQALDKYSAAAEIRRALGDQRGYATSLRNRARVARAMGRAAEAGPDLTRAREIFQKIGDLGGQADVANDFGALHEGRGDYAAALGAYQEALRLRRSLGDQRQIAQSYDNVGYVFFMKGEYDNALVFWQQALELRKKIGQTRGVILSTQNLGFLQTAQGHFPEATKSFLDALEQSRQLDFKNAIAVSYGNLGLLQQYDGRYGAALLSYDRALEVLKGLSDKQGLAEFTLKQAEALLELGALEAARARLDAAEPWVRETDNHERSSVYLAARAEWQQARGQRDEARRTVGQAVARATASHSRAALLRARLLEADLRAAADAGSGLVALRNVSREADGLGDVVLRIRAGEALARAELRQGRAAVAEELAAKALGLADRAGWEAGRWRLHALLGLAADERGDAAGAALHYAASAEGITRIRAEVPADMRPAFDALSPVRQVQAWQAAHGRGAPPPGPAPPRP